MKKFFLIVTASVFCVTSFAETVQQDSESIEASAEFMSPSESMGPNDDGFIYKGTLLWQGDKNSILETDCQQLKDFVCANTLARNIIEGR